MKLSAVLLLPLAQGFNLATPLFGVNRRTMALGACGVFFGTSTGNTEEVADALVSCLE